MREKPQLLGVAGGAVSLGALALAFGTFLDGNVFAKRVDSTIAMADPKRLR